MSETPLICVICKKPIPVVGGWAGGSNAEPVAEGRCCAKCDARVVIPTRIAMLRLASKGSA